MVVRALRRALLLSVLALAAAPSAAADHVEDLDAEVPWGCSGRDCIPSIDEPTFDDGDWLRDEDRVLGLVWNGEARAYPVRILNWHEIVNDEVGGTPILVTYCPLCATGVAFERSVDGEVTSFGVSGRLFRNDLVMYDRATESLWSQELGEAIWGPKHGTQLTFVPVATTTWAEWRERHPDTRVLARPDTYPSWQYDRYPYGDYESSDGTLFPVASPSNQLAAKEWVLGVFTDNESVAYRQDDVREVDFLVDSVQGEPLVVVDVAGSPRAWWTDGRNLSYAEGRLVDDRGHSWDALTGEGSDGAQLRAPRQVLGFWFAWHDFHPETRVWGRLLVGVVPEMGEEARVLLLFSEPVDRTLVEAALPSDASPEWVDDRTVRVHAERFVLPPGEYGINGTALLEPVEVRPPSARQLTVPGASVVAMVVAVALVTLLAGRRVRRS